MATTNSEQAPGSHKAKSKYFQVYNSMGGEVRIFIPSFGESMCAFTTNTTGKVKIGCHQSHSELLKAFIPYGFDGKRKIEFAGNGEIQGACVEQAQSIFYILQPVL